MKIPQLALIELHLLHNRLEAGESPQQAMSQMKKTEKLPESFTRAWRWLEGALIEGRLSPAQAVAEFTERYQKSNDLADLIEQKSMSARLQSSISTVLSLLVILIAPFFFPEILRPQFLDIVVSLSLLGIAYLWQKRMLERFRKECSFLDWLHFFRGLSLSLQSGVIFPRAVKENRPAESLTSSWPADIHKQIMQEQVALPLADEHGSTTHPKRIASYWQLARTSWSELQRLYESGHPLSKLIVHLSDVQEKTFRREILLQAEKLSYRLMLPLFLLSVPAMMWLFFSPLLRSLSSLGQR